MTSAAQQDTPADAHRQVIGAADRGPIKSCYLLAHSADIIKTLKKKTRNKRVEKEEEDEDFTDPE